MQNIKKYFMTLALLITAVTGAWADYTVTWEGTTLQGIAVSSNSVHTPNTTQTVEGITVTASNGDFFYNTTYPKGPVVIAQSSADNGLVFSAENNIKSIAITFTELSYYGGSMVLAGAHTYQVSPAAKSFALPKSDLFIGITKVVFTLEGDAPVAGPEVIELKPDETGKNWILAEMPASNIELQVEYYPESYLFLSKDALADKANISVTAGELGVQFGEDGKSANPVAEGTAMTVKYNGTKKILGMNVEKKSAYEHSITIAVDPRTTEPKATAPAMTIEFNTGETWADVAARYDWLDTYETYTVFYKDDILYGDVHDANGGVKPNQTIDPNGSYHWEM